MKKIKFISIWDNGFEVTSNAELNMQTGEIVNISDNDITEEEELELEVLDNQVIELNGERFEVEEDVKGMPYSVDLTIL